MAQDSGPPKAPEPLQPPKKAVQEDEEKTDPFLVVPQKEGAAASTPSQTPSNPPPAQPNTQGTASSPQAPPAQTLPKPKMPNMGPLDVFMKDPSITEIMVNDVRNVMVEKDGKMLYSGFTFQGLDELNRVTRNILDITGRILSPDQPYVDTMLPDGSRINIIAPPLTLYGPNLTIRKFPAKRLTANDLIATETFDQRIGYFLNICVVGQLNILISGGTGSGKTTLLNVLAAFIPKNQRIITIEDTPELSIGHFNSVSLQTKPQTPTANAVTARDLVANALRMRPDRIIVGECRRAEAFDMLQAMNTGHTGSMTTLHANSPRDALARLETLCMLAGVELPVTAIRKQMASALDLIIQIHRLRNGKRKVVSVTEVTGMEGDTITLQDLFLFEMDQSQANPTETGIFKPTGLVPTFLEKLRILGLEFPRNYFG